MGPSTERLTASLERRAAPIRANYDDYGSDDFPVWMTPEQKAADDRAEKAEERAAKAASTDPLERRFHHAQVTRLNRSARAFERRAPERAAERTPRARPRGAGRPGHRRANRTRAGPQDDEGPAEPGDQSEVAADLNRIARRLRSSGKGVG